MTTHLRQMNSNSKPILNQSFNTLSHIGINERSCLLFEKYLEKKTKKNNFLILNCNMKNNI